MGPTMLHGSAPRTLDLDRAFGRADIAGPREAPLSIVNAAESAVDYSALRDPSRFPMGTGTFRGERAVDPILVPSAPSADLYQGAVVDKVRAWEGSTRSSEMHGHVPNGGTTAVEYVAAKVGTTRGADSMFDGPQAAWMSADTARGALIRLPNTAQFTSVPDRNGQHGAVLAARVTCVAGGRHGTATLFGEASAERSSAGASCRARAVATRMVTAPLHVAPHDAPHRTVAARGAWIGGAEPTRRVAACSAPYEMATTASAWSVAARPAMAVSTTRVAIAPGVMPSRVLASTGHLVSEVDTARAAPLRLAELGGRALGGLDRSAQDVATSRLEAYRLADLNGRVLGTLDGNAAPASTRFGSEGGALPVIGEHGGERHARVEAQSEARRLAGSHAPLREASHSVGPAGVARVAPTLRVCGDARAGYQPEPSAVGIAGPMARVAVGPTRREETAWFR
jgi:hypothetical protein